MSQKPLVAVLTGAGISAESGIPTFRDANGLWENHSIYDVATPEGFAQNPELVLRFYNQRRQALANVEPHAGHLSLVELEQRYDVVIITQNVDDLHERAGSCHIIHLHGELTKVRSTAHPDLVYDYGYRTISIGDVCERGAQLRPHIVWFGEEVPEYERALRVVEKADYVVVVGTSMQVYPAAGLVDEAPPHAMIYVVNPSMPGFKRNSRYVLYEENASKGVPKVVRELLAK